MSKILLNSGNALFLWFENSKCPFSSFFPGTSKIATLAQNFDYKKALLGPKGGTTAHRKFRGFQKWGQILP